MDYTQIEKEAMSLNFDDKLALRRRLTQSINAINAPEPDIAPEVAAAVAEDITGGKVTGNRKRINHYARCLAAYRLHAGGAKNEAIAEVFGLNRTSIYHALKVMEDTIAMPFTCPELARYWNEMDKRLPL